MAGRNVPFFTALAVGAPGTFVPLSLVVPAAGRGDRIVTSG
ncbi:hypothetical protein [Actinophytocola sp. KF-1]